MLIQITKDKRLKDDNFTNAEISASPKISIQRIDNYQIMQNYNHLFPYKLDFQNVIAFTITIVGTFSFSIASDLIADWIWNKVNRYTKSVTINITTIYSKETTFEFDRNQIKKIVIKEILKEK
jgi:hypothetical protein